MNRTEIFSDIYRRQHIGNGWHGIESASGIGSDLSATVPVREALPSLLRNLVVRSLLDAPCGDFNWMKEVDLPLDWYVGLDIVPDLIATNHKLYSNTQIDFMLGDIVKSELPKADAILCRDGLVHLSIEDVLQALTNFRSSDARYLLATTHLDCQKNTDIKTGDWRMIRMELPPFNLGDPIHIITEVGGSVAATNFGKSLGVWKINE